MFYCINTTYAKVWKILRTEQKYMDLRITTSEKGQNGEYIDSTWFPRVIGHAFNSLKDTLKEGDKIVITKAIINNPSYKAADGSPKSSLKVKILEAKIDDRAPKDTPNNGATEPEETCTPTTNTSAANDTKEEIPW